MKVFDLCPHFFKNGRAEVKGTNGKWEFIDKLRNLVIPCIWKGVWAFTDVLAVVVDEEANELAMDKTGKIVERP